MREVVHKILAQQLRAGKLLCRFVKGRLERLDFLRLVAALGRRQTHGKVPCCQSVHRLHTVYHGLDQDKADRHHKADGHQNTAGIQNHQCAPYADFAVAKEKAVVCPQHNQHRGSGQVQCDHKKQVQHQQHRQICRACAAAQLVYPLRHIMPSLPRGNRCREWSVFQTLTSHKTGCADG